MTRAKTYCLGLDTSCYTTSVALCRGTAEGPFFQARKLLTVPEGARGLMQSEAVFQHITRLPLLIEALVQDHPSLDIVAVCASTRPRPAEDSYMPVFRVGESIGRAIAAAWRLPFLETTHQEGHIRAGRIGTPLRADQPFLALHLSGGTSEVLRVAEGRVRLLGGTLDLHAGQLIDRVGVAMGLPFPAGPALEQLALEGTATSRLKASVRGASFHFSGAEAQAYRWIQEGSLSREDIAAEVFSCVARTVSRAILTASAQEALLDVSLSGGVASSGLICQEVRTRVAKRNRNIRLHFARKDLSGDNAVGVALIGIETLEANRR